MQVSAARFDKGATQAERIYQTLRERIVTYELRPGERLVEERVAREFGASRTPVRESLRRLEQAGLVRKDGRQGCFVRELDLAEMDHLYDVRLALETLAVRSLARILTVEKTEQLWSIWRSFPLQGSPGDAVEQDEAFHVAIATLSGNSALTEFLGIVNDRIHLIRRTDFTHSARLSATKTEHEMILRALEQQRFDLCEELLTKHILHSKENVYRLAQEGLARVYLSDAQRGQPTHLVGREMMSFDDEQADSVG
jgi:DNA-binding GntR family transcriptional regulator